MLCITEVKESKIDGEYYRACDTFLHLGIPFKIYLHLMHMCVFVHARVCVRACTFCIFYCIKYPNYDA